MEVRRRPSVRQPQIRENWIPRGTRRFPHRCQCPCGRSLECGPGQRQPHRRGLGSCQSHQCQLCRCDAHRSGVRGNRWFSEFIASGANLRTANLKSANLARANLNCTNFTFAFLNNADLTNADLNGANLTNADLAGAVVTGATVTGATWSNTVCPDSTNGNTDGNTCVGHGF